jgi:hypothetical protein
MTKIEWKFSEVSQEIIKHTGQARHQWLTPVVLVGERDQEDGS